MLAGVVDDEEVEEEVEEEDDEPFSLKLNTDITCRRDSRVSARETSWQLELELSICVVCSIGGGDWWQSGMKSASRANKQNNDYVMLEDMGFGKVYGFVHFCYKIENWR